MPRQYPVYDKAPEHPFKCVVSGLRGPVIDLGAFIPNYGRVYLSLNVLAAIAEARGYTDPTASAEAAERIANLEGLQSAATEFLEGFVLDVRDSADRAHRLLHGESAADDGGAVPDDAGADEDAVAAADADGEEPRPARRPRAGRRGAGAVSADADLPFDQPPATEDGDAVSSA